MSINPTVRGLVSTFFALAAALSLTSSAWSQVQAPQILAIRPKIDDGPFTTPKAEDIPKLTVSVIKIAGGGSGYLLTDNSTPPNTIRKFYDSDGDNRVDTWCFYANGVEVYREQLTKTGYSFRWMGPGGMKWGVGGLDGAQKAKIEQWKMISAEEAAQEAFAALTTGDFDRMKALFISPEEMKAIGLPANEVVALTKRQEDAPKKFQAMRLAVKGLAQAKFSRLENAQPGCYLAEVTGGAQDIIKARGLILFENPNAQKQHDFLHSSSIIQVGNAWRLTDIPSTEDPDVGPGPGPGPNDPMLAKLYTLLAEYDKNVPGPTDKNLPTWTAGRLQVVEQIVNNPKTSAQDKENFTKQAFDNLSSAYIGGHKDFAGELAKWRTKVITANPPGSCLAAYGVYREILADYQVKVSGITNVGPLAEIQAKHYKDLAKFVEDYPTCDDTADALIQLAMGSEFNAKEAEAKKYLNELVKKFPNSPSGQKAAGAIKRIDAVGEIFTLAGPTDKGTPYDIKAARGKAAVVYYWASFSNQTNGDFATLKKLQTDLGNKVEIICVNLDEKLADAQPMMLKAPPGVVHLHAPGGMNGPLAMQYGVFALPHAFLIDRDGKAVNNRVNVGALDDEIAKMK